MAVYPVQNGPIPINIHLIPSVRREGIGKKMLQEMEDLPGKEFSSRNHPDLVELQKINDSWNSIAQNERAHGKMLNEIEDYIDRMKAQLERIIKNFPPFPPGSGERIRLLQNFSAFRKLIAQLTIPPGEEFKVGPENP